MAFSPDGAHVVSGSDDRTVRIWDATTGARGDEDGGAQGLGPIRGILPRRRHRSIQETACGGLQVGRVASYHLLEAMWGVGTVKLELSSSLPIVYTLYLAEQYKGPLS